MSAREELTNELCQWRSSEDMEWVSSRFDDLQNEILRKAAAKIRAEVEDWDGWPEKQQHWNTVADFIDPDKGK